MSIVERKTIIEEGDWVVFYEGFDNCRAVQLKHKQSYQNRTGTFFHSDIIGKVYGSRIPSGGKTANQGEIVILHLTPQFWTDILNHRTQILFQPDISMVLHHLDIKPGHVIIESGTGSGSLTTSLARAVAPHGHVHTFEFNIDRVNKAKIDFQNNHIDELVTVRHRDVCGTGFPYFPEGVDAVFLDLPSPWVVLDDCHRNLRPQGKICSFSPCIEQVQRVCSRLMELGYEDIFTIEILVKHLEVFQNRVKPIDLAQMYSDLPNLYKPLKQTESQENNVTIEDNTTDSNEGPRKKMKFHENTSTIAFRSESHKVQVPNPTLTSKPTPTMRGHTGYLTFARKQVNCVVGQFDTKVQTTATEIHVEEKEADDDELPAEQDQ